MNQINQKEFDNILIRLLSELKANQIIDIPGIYEILSEYFNNDILNIWEMDQDENN